MTRTMGDATHDGVPVLALARPQMVAGYVTGSPSVQWTSADWALFPGIPHATIDQGFTGSPVASANVRDVEAGAWTNAAAVNRNGWTAPRPTIYCSLANIAALEQAGWQGDVWIADYVSAPPSAPPQLGNGMTVVAWQWTNTGGGGAYDLSVVFDPTWPELTPVQPTHEENPMIIYLPQGIYLLSGGRMHHVQDPAAASIYQSMGIPQSTVAVSAAEAAALLADFPPGQPVVTVPPITVPPVQVTFPAFNTSGTITPA